MEFSYWRGSDAVEVMAQPVMVRPLAVSSEMLFDKDRLSVPVIIGPMPARVAGNVNGNAPKPFVSFVSPLRIRSTVCRPVIWLSAAAS